MVNINCFCQLNSNLEWKVLETVTGNKAITLPAKWMELNILIAIGGDVDANPTVALNVSKANVVGSTKTIRGGYYLNVNSYGFVQLNINVNSMQLSVANANGQSLIETTHMRVSYR